MAKTTKKDARGLTEIERAFIAKVFETALEEKGWKPVDLARALGFSNGWASNIMTERRGKRSLTINLLYEIAEKLEVDPTSLLPDIKDFRPKISLEEFFWLSIKEKLDKYLDEKIEQRLKEKK